MSINRIESIKTLKNIYEVVIDSVNPPKLLGLELNKQTLATLIEKLGEGKEPILSQIIVQGGLIGIFPTVGSSAYSYIDDPKHALKLFDRLHQGSVDLGDFSPLTRQVFINPDTIFLKEISRIVKNKDNQETQALSPNQLLDTAKNRMFISAAKTLREELKHSFQRSTLYYSKASLVFPMPRIIHKLIENRAQVVHLDPELLHLSQQAIILDMKIDDQQIFELIEICQESFSYRS